MTTETVTKKSPQVGEVQQCKIFNRRIPALQVSCASKQNSIRTLQWGGRDISLSVESHEVTHATCRTLWPDLRRARGTWSQDDTRGQARCIELVIGAKPTQTNYLNGKRSNKKKHDFAASKFVRGCGACPGGLSKTRTCLLCSFLWVMSDPASHMLPFDLLASHGIGFLQRAGGVCGWRD